MGLIEHYPERIRIDRTLDKGHLLGPFSADRTNGRSDMESCIYVRADLHRGAVSSSIAQTRSLVDAVERDLNDVGPWGNGYRQALADVRRQLDLRFGGQ